MMPEYAIYGMQVANPGLHMCQQRHTFEGGDTAFPRSRERHKRSHMLGPAKCKDKLTQDHSNATPCNELCPQGQVTGASSKYHAVLCTLCNMPHPEVYVMLTLCRRYNPCARLR